MVGVGIGEPGRFFFEALRVEVGAAGLGGAEEVAVLGEEHAGLGSLGGGGCVDWFQSEHGWRILEVRPEPWRIGVWNARRGRDDSGSSV